MSLKDDFFFFLADVHIFDDMSCRRSYGSVYDPNTEICAGDYNHKADTMVSESNLNIESLIFFSLKRVVTPVVLY